MISNENLIRIDMDPCEKSPQQSHEFQPYCNEDFSQIQKMLKALCLKKGVSQYYSKAELVAKRFWSEIPIRSKRKNANLVVSASLCSVVRTFCIYYDFSDFTPESVSNRIFHRAVFRCMMIVKDIFKENMDLITFQKNNIIQFHNLMESFLRYWNLSHAKKVQKSIIILANWLIDIIGNQIPPKLVVPVSFSLSVLALGKYNEYKIYHIAKKSKVAISALNNNIYRICSKIGIKDKKFSEINELLASQIHRLFLK